MKKTLFALIGLAACGALGQGPYVPFPSSTGGLQPQTANGYALAIDSSDWANTAITNGAVIEVVTYATNYVWKEGYSQYTNSPQTRVFVASMKTPAFAGAKLSAIKTYWRAYNIADVCTVTASYPGQTNILISATLDTAASGALEIDETLVTNVVNSASLAWRATITVTAETDDGSWTALPRIEAVWGE